MKITIDEASTGIRLDILLTKKIQDLNRSSINRLITDKKVFVNDKIVKAGYKLKSNDIISVDYNKKILDKQKIIELPIIYEDDDCIVIDKPVGVLTHSKGVFNPEGTVASFIYPKIQGLTGERAGIVHRLDRGTSGIIICAKNNKTLKWLQKQFSTRKVTKTYIAIIFGEIKPPAAIINMPIARNPIKRQTYSVQKDGKEAVTSYKVICVHNGYSLVELIPKTGRTHQLRVHLKQLKHPIVGDPIYGGKTFERLLLHAIKLEITLPNNIKKIFYSPPPKIFNQLVSYEYLA